MGVCNWPNSVEYGSMSITLLKCVVRESESDILGLDLGCLTVESFQVN